MFPKIVHASHHTDTAFAFLEKLNEAILYPLIALMMATALLIFLYGCFEYVMNSANEEGRRTGQRHIMWGLVGMLVMLSAYAILELAANTFGLGSDLEEATGDAGFFGT